MRMNVTELKIDYREKYIDMLFKLVGEQHRTSLTLSYRQWDFVVEAMAEEADLQIGDFALMDGMRPVEFFSDGIRIHEYGGNDSTMIHFPFDALQNAIAAQWADIGPDTLRQLHWRYWPKTKIIWDERIDKSIVRQVWPEISKWVRFNRRVAANHSDGQLCVVHMYPDGREGWTQEKFDKGERPSFYWEIRRYVPKVETEYGLAEIVHMSKVWQADKAIRRSGEYPHYGLIMNGGLIWHPNRNGDGGEYSIHT